ncbi:DUF2231 domain-containing protein [Sphingomonas flavalba]|uniref:DUF2231 domain-containing protein n=1 Tax=Sphingomonas flavalba TaxID=2559804 RepID=UPI00109E0D11|nr:DUF2231 domain-containing protein [Sphingomonas flavalba]
MRLFGHPIHPMLVHFPVALWALATAGDALTLAGVAAAWPLAWLCTAAGVALAIPAMAAGLVDFAALAEEAVPVALRHMTLIGGAFTAYATSLVLRSDGLAALPSPALSAMAAGLAGLLLLTAGAWQGGQLVYRFGAGTSARR